MVTIREENLVGPVNQVVVREGLEEFLGLGLMVRPAASRFRLPWPVHGRVRGVSLPEYLPILLVPCVVQRLPQFQKLVSLHDPPRVLRTPGTPTYLCPSLLL